MPWIRRDRWHWLEHSVRTLNDKLIRIERKLNVNSLSLEDQRKVNEIYAKAKDTSAKIDESMS